MQHGIFGCESQNLSLAKRQTGGRDKRQRYYQAHLKASTAGANLENFQIRGFSSSEYIANLV